MQLRAMLVTNMITLKNTIDAEKVMKLLFTKRKPFPLQKVPPHLLIQNILSIDNQHMTARLNRVKYVTVFHRKLMELCKAYVNRGDENEDFRLHMQRGHNGVNRDDQNLAASDGARNRQRGTARGVGTMTRAAAAKVLKAEGD